jgi:lambda family phage tail tape measure protein
MAKDITVVLTLNDKQFQSAINQSTKDVKAFGQTATTTASGVGKAFKALGAVVAGVGIIRLADEFTTLNNRLRAVTKSEEEAATALQLVKDVASATRSDLASVAGLFADITIASEELGLTQERVAGIAKVFSQSLKISGADAGTAAGAIRQFGQALASGVLRGDEFNSINEANSRFMGELAKAMGVTRGELRKLAEQGKITSKAMIRATEQMASTVEADFAKTTLTIGDAFTKLKNSVLGLFGIAGETGAFEGLAKSIENLANNIDSFGVSLKESTVSLTTVIGLVGGLGLAFGALKGVGPAILAIISGGMDALENKAGKATVKFLGLGEAGKKSAGIFSRLKDVFVNLGRFLGTFVGLNKGGKILTTVGKAAGGAGKQLDLFAKSGQKLNVFQKIFTRMVQAVFTGSGVFASLGRFAASLFSGPAAVFVLATTAVDALVEAFFGFSIIEVVINLFKKLLNILGTFVGYIYDFIVPAFETVYGWLKDLATATKEWAEPFVDFLASMGLIEKVARDVDAASTAVANMPVDKLSDAATAADAAADGMARLAVAGKQLEDMSEGLLKDFDSGKFNTTLENAEIRLKKARDASWALSVRIVELDKGSDDYAETLANLLRLQQAVNAEIGQATNVISDLHNQYKQIVDDAKEGISLDFGLKELETQLAEFDLSEVDKEVNQFYRDIEANFAENQESLKQLLSDRDLPEAYREQLQQLLDTLPGITEEARRRGEELIRALANKELLREQTQEFNDALTELGTIETPDGLEAFRLRIEELARTGEITADQFEKLKQAGLDLEASLGAGAGIGKALEEIGKQFTPFQMAVDATTMAWGHMSDAIDQFVETGKASFSDLAKSILRDLAKMILKQMLYNALVGAIQAGAGALGVTIPGLATGGPAQKNKPYIVGEQGPELFVPQASGTVIPNNRLGDMGGQISAPVTNNYITNQISALDAKSVAQLFAENRQALLGTVEYARKETAYGV